MAKFNFFVSRLLCDKVRDYLKRRKFEGDDIEWFESSGLLEREFVIKGDDAQVWQILEDIKQYERQLMI